MEKVGIKDDSDLITKIIDSLYKKLIILLAIDGGFGAYAIKFLQNGNWIGYGFALIFVFVAIAIFYSYIDLNYFVKKLKRIHHG
jgi:nicotinamide riboside transporter PnuC